MLNHGISQIDVPNDHPSVCHNLVGLFGHGHRTGCRLLISLSILSRSLQVPLGDEDQ